MAADDDRTDDDGADPIDEAAAEIDPRSPDAAEQIDALEELAEDLGRDVESPPPGRADPPPAPA